MNAPENKELVSRFYATIDAVQQMSPISRFVSVGFTAHVAGIPSPLDAAGLGHFGDAFYAAFPGLRHDVEEMVCDGDRVCTRLVARGTQTRELNGPQGTIPASDREMAMKAMTICRVNDGRVAELWIEMDLLGALQQLGVIPREEAVPA
jgi:predicted ester cyclase